MSDCCHRYLIMPLVEIHWNTQPLPLFGFDGWRLSLFSGLLLRQYRSLHGRSHAWKVWTTGRFWDLLGCTIWRSFDKSPDSRCLRVRNILQNDGWCLGCDFSAHLSQVRSAGNDRGIWCTPLGNICSVVIPKCLNLWVLYLQEDKQLTNIIWQDGHHPKKSGSYAISRRFESIFLQDCKLGDESLGSPTSKFATARTTYAWCWSTFASFRPQTWCNYRQHENQTGSLDLLKTDENSIFSSQENGINEQIS